MLALAAVLAVLVADTSRAAHTARKAVPDSVVTAEPDRWLGGDKFKHFAMSYAVTSFAFAGSRTLFEDDTSLGLAIAAGSTAGLLKELYDRARGRPFSKRDLVWDAAGIAVGYVIARQTTWK